MSVYANLRRSGKTQEARDALEKGRDLCREIDDPVREAEAGALARMVAEFREACAGRPDTAPMLSGVAFARPPQDSLEDGILTVRELFDLNLAADMLVISALRQAALSLRRDGKHAHPFFWCPFLVMGDWL